MQTVFLPGKQFSNFFHPRPDRPFELISTHYRPSITVIDAMKTIFLTLRLLIAPLVLGLGLSSATAAETAVPRTKHVDAAGAAKLLEAKPDVVILDIRTGEEFKDGHLAKAVNIDFYDKAFGEKIDKLDKDKTYLVHCAVGGRSTKSLDQFKAKGFKNIYHLDGGYKAWEAAGKPVTK